MRMKKLCANYVEKSTPLKNRKLFVSLRELLKWNFNILISKCRNDHNCMFLIPLRRFEPPPGVQILNIRARWLRRRGCKDLFEEKQFLIDYIMDKYEPDSFFNHLVIIDEILESSPNIHTIYNAVLSSFTRPEELQ